MLDSSKTMTKLTCIVIPIDFYQRKPFILTHNYIVLLFHFVCLGLSLSIVWSFWLKIQSANLRFNRTFSLQSTKIAWIIPKELMIFMFFLLPSLFSRLFCLFFTRFTKFRTQFFRFLKTEKYIKIGFLCSLASPFCCQQTSPSAIVVVVILLYCFVCMLLTLAFFSFIRNVRRAKKTSTISHVSGSGQNANNL